MQSWVSGCYTSTTTNDVVSEWENSDQKIGLINYVLEMWLPSEGAWTLNFSRPREREHSIVPSLVVSVGSVFAFHLVVGPSVELLYGSTPGPGISRTTTVRRGVDRGKIMKAGGVVSFVLVRSAVDLLLHREPNSMYCTCRRKSRPVQ
jgi:hypothetical protein